MELNRFYHIHSLKDFGQLDSLMNELAKKTDRIILIDPHGYLLYYEIKNEDGKPYQINRLNYLPSEDEIDEDSRKDSRKDNLFIIYPHQILMQKAFATHDDEYILKLNQLKKTLTRLE